MKFDRIEKINIAEAVEKLLPHGSGIDYTTKARKGRNTMSKTIYLCTCKDALTEEKYAFEDVSKAEKCFSECVQQAFAWEETETDNDGWNAEECLLNWEFHCGDYSAKIEKVTVEG